MVAQAQEQAGGHSSKAKLQPHTSFSVFLDNHLKSQTSWSLLNSAGETSLWCGHN